MNSKVLINSLLALAFALLGIFVNWLFLIPAVILMFINQRLLFPSKKSYLLS